MNETQWSASTSNEYKAKQLAVAVGSWVIFNIFSGFLTGDYSLNDNYFVLSILLIVMAGKLSYKVIFGNGYVVTHQFGMVTQNIDLYKASEVKEENGRLIIFCPNDTRFNIKLSALEKPAQETARVTIVPHEGVPPKETEALNMEEVETIKEPNYLRSLIGGGVLLILGIVSIFTDVVYLPSRHGFVYASQDPSSFVLLQSFCLIVGALGILYAGLGLWRQRA